MSSTGRTWVSLVGLLAAVIFLIISWITLGWLKMILFALFLSLALQDALTGKITGIAFLPMAGLLFVFHPIPTLEIFVPIFGILLGIWLVVRILQKKEALDPGKIYFGSGDVVGVPFAVTLAQIFLPVLGLAAFALGALGVMPWFMKKKSRRLMPWLIPGVSLAFLAALVFA